MNLSKFSFKFSKNNFVLFGNPLFHSLSPIIHNCFFSQNNSLYTYRKIVCTKVNFFSFIKFFFKYYGIGANITLPFKKDAVHITTQLTKNAKVSNTVNTLLKLDNKNILGDNTDGLGLLYDLNRLNYIYKNCKILLLGAGGASESIIYSLLSQNCYIYILNRTVKKAEFLVEKFKKFGYIKLFNESSIFVFDCIINATSSSLYNQIPCFPNFCISKKTCCYDLFYSKNNDLTAFLKFCKSLGAIKLSDGLGMLIAQAAYSHLLWFNFFPDILKVLNYVKKNVILY